MYQKEERDYHNIKENNMTILEEEKPHAVMSDHQKETLADINRIMQVIEKISEFIEATYEQNTLGARLVNTLIHQYFIKKGKLGLEQAKEISFQKKLSF